jgi:hypothetical protein
LQRGYDIITPATQAFMDGIGYVPEADSETWLNDRYVVKVLRHEDGWVQRLSIRRQDRKAVHDWRDFQRIKDQLAGPDVEAIELYPARVRLVDTANQYWLWCLRPGRVVPVGFPDGIVGDQDEGPGTGSQQRAFDPADRTADGIASQAKPLTDLVNRLTLGDLADETTPASDG